MEGHGIAPETLRRYWQNVLERTAALSPRIPPDEPLVVASAELAAGRVDAKAFGRLIEQTHSRFKDGWTSCLLSPHTYKRRADAPHGHGSDAESVDPVWIGVLVNERGEIRLDLDAPAPWITRRHLFSITPLAAAERADKFAAVTGAPKTFAEALAYAQSLLDSATEAKSSLKSLYQQSTHGRLVVSGSIANPYRSITAVYADLAAHPATHTHALDLLAMWEGDVPAALDPAGACLSAAQPALILTATRRLLSEAAHDKPGFLVVECDGGTSEQRERCLRVIVADSFIRSAIADEPRPTTALVCMPNVDAKALVVFEVPEINTATPRVLTKRWIAGLPSVATWHVNPQHQEPGPGVVWLAGSGEDGTAWHAVPTVSAQIDALEYRWLRLAEEALEVDDLDVAEAVSALNRRLRSCYARDEAGVETFLYALHYWEGRWLAASRASLDANGKSTQINAAMLTPWTVTSVLGGPDAARTVHGFAYGSMDLLVARDGELIANTVLPALLALAKSAIIFADCGTAQRHTTLPTALDKALFGAAASATGCTATHADATKAGLGALSGSVLQRALALSAATPHEAPAKASKGRPLMAGFPGD